MSDIQDSQDKTRPGRVPDPSGRGRSADGVSVGGLPLRGLPFRAVAIEAGIGLFVIALSVAVGPFGTFDDLTLPDRVTYWGLAVGLNWLQIRLILAALERLTGPDRVWLPALAASLLSAIPATFEVLWLESRFRDTFDGQLSFFLLYPYVVLLSVAVTVPVVHLVRYREAGAVDTTAAETAIPDNAADADADKSPDPSDPASDGYKRMQTDNNNEYPIKTEISPTPPRLLARLPDRLGSEICCLQAEDHYVRVHTRGGNDLVLIRFADAMAEMDGTAGLQVHRSWWVVAHAINVVERRDRKTWLKLTNGLDVPVSRTFLPALRAITQRKDTGP